MFINNNSIEGYKVIEDVNSFAKCATKCKKTVNCYGFEFTPSNECRLHGDTIKMDDQEIPDENIICNKKETIDDYKFNGFLSKEHKLRNAIYKCKSYDRFTKVYNNGDEVFNISGKHNFEIGNTLKDYDLVNDGPIY